MHLEVITRLPRNAESRAIRAAPSRDGPGPGRGRRTADASGATEVMIPGVGHDLMLDSRRESAARAILDRLGDRGL